MDPKRGWLWHLAEQVAGRSQGQIPHASLHDQFLLLVIRIAICQQNTNQDY
jgi:hypothetical protein